MLDIQLIFASRCNKSSSQTSRISYEFLLYAGRIVKRVALAALLYTPHSGSRYSRKVEGVSCYYCN